MILIQRLKRLGTRGFSALPQTSLADSLTNISNDAARRLREMESGQATALRPLPYRRGSETDTQPEPSTSATAVWKPRRSCSPTPLSDPPPPRRTKAGTHTTPAWRDILDRARQLYSTSGDTLTDSFGRRHSYLRISLTERCNLRCVYCMPEEGVQLTPKQKLLSNEEVVRLAKLFVAEGVTKIRLTGGEPTLRPDLADLCRELKAIQGLESLALTTNGIVLERMLPGLKAAGLDKINVSLDTLRPDRFERMARRPREGLAKVLSSIHAAVRLGYDPLKVNVVVVRGVNDDEIGDFVRMASEHPVNVRFIEYMPFGGGGWSGDRLVSYKEMLARAEESLASSPSPSAPRLERERDPRGEVAKNFRIPGRPGRVSFVTSMTEHFCSECDRLRIMADGNLKVCLFGHNEVSLRDAVRAGVSDPDLRLIVKASVMRKKAQHAGMFELARRADDGRAMVQIGG